ncbi:MAG TPA: hypothetical protein DCQ06_13150, partial [Myxococcales bacterium]|nr:hypothetical protein [Myxococcales bacterium]
MYIGPWRALEISVQEGTLSAKTPPGVPGAAHVRMQCGASSVLVADGYEYRPAKPEIHAVSPRKGATGGGTLVAVHGAGFTESTEIYFDGLQGQQTQVVNGALIRTKTPAHAPGTVNVEVTSPGGGDVLLNSFEYFSPTNPQGGTYGEGLQGTLNVTVLDIYSLKPLEGAFVQVGQPDDPDYPKYGGVTDDSGQIVFSGTDLTPPVTVSAAKKEYSTSSIVNFEVGNATLLLFPWVPPSPGPGQPGPGLPLATVKGRVLDVDKYLLRPPTTCTKPSMGGPQCDFCEQDTDCSTAAGAGGKQWACVVTGGTAKRCFSICQDDGDCDNNKDFVCVQDVFDDTRKVCQPSVGIREITCKSSTRGLDTLNPDPGPGAQVDEMTGDYAITVRLDELAVYCVGGYRRKGVFRPTAMGVRRHIFPQPGQTIEGIDIKLNIPLVRDLPVRLDNPEPFHPANNGGDLEVKGWIHLGSDGYVPVAKRQNLAADSTSGSAVVNDFELSAQPLTLPEELTDSTYTWRAVVDYGHLATPVPMESGTFHANVVKPGDANLWVREDGKWQTGQIGLSTTLAAALPGQATDVLYVGDDGRVFRGSIDDAYTLWLPSLPDPYAEAPTILAAAGTPTDATMVGIDGLIRRLTINAAEVVTVVQETGAVTDDLYGVCQVAQGRVAVGASGALQIDVGGGWTALASGTQSDLLAVACDSAGAVAVGDLGTVVRISWANPSPQLSTASAKRLRDVKFASDGQVWVAGQSTAGYGVLLRSVAGGTWTSAWPPGTNPSATPALCCLTESSSGVWLLATDQGGLWRLTPSSLTDQSPLRRDVAPKDLATRSDGSVIVVGIPVLWLGPFLTVADLSAPKDVVSANSVQVEWAYVAGPAATITRVHLNGMGFPFWWLYVNPTTTSVNLPDFTALSALTTLPTLQTPYAA